MKKESTSTAWHRKHPERSREFARKWREANPEKVKEMAKRKRESGRGRCEALQYKYGITLEQREAMLDAQGRACAICHSTDPGWKHYWAVDHCHQTKRVRSILCHSCNIVLGRVKEDVSTLERMIKYIEKHNGAAFNA